MDPGATWVAWLSTFSVNAMDRLTATGPFVRATEVGTTIAVDIADLTDGNLNAAILFDETGALPAPTLVWTGTEADGTVSTTSAVCPNPWNLVIPTAFALVGGLDESGFAWTAETLISCDSLARIYCFEQTTSVSTFPPVGLALLAMLLLAGGAYLYRRHLAG